MRKHKAFTGIRFSLFELNANQFNGYGFSLFSCYYDSVSWVTHSNGGPLFSINWNLHREKGGKEYRLWLCLFFVFGFYAFKWTVESERERCKFCYDQYSKLEFGAYCSKECMEYDEMM